MKLDLPSSPLADVDPEFEKVGVETAQLVFALAGTNMREKLLQNLTQDICRSQLGLPFRMHVTAASMHGLCYADLLAAIRFIAPYAGYPAAADALGRVRQIADEIGMDTADVGETPSGPVESADTIATADDWMTMFLHSRISRAWSEHRLSSREKAIIAITSDVSGQTLAESFRHHVGLALDAGVSKDQLRDVVRFCAEHSLARAVAALRELDAVLDEY
ncbi:MAG: carboxymuconolactone decarboxylase family protein [Actinomycetota bacterium]|nr:carboxymuconolactone decarboxylase family protein [Actinomycetota bacterium]